MTKNDLNEIRWMMKNILQLEESLTELRNKSINITPVISDGIRSTKSEDKTASSVAAIIDTENMITCKLNIAYEKVRRMEEYIGSFSEKEQLLIRLRYIRGKSWEYICIDMGYSWRNIHRIHADILKKLKEK